MNNIISRETVKNDILGEQYEKITLSCGLGIYVFPKKFTSTYAIFGVKYGSVHNRFALDENSPITDFPQGIAHFLEHKMFTNEDGSDSFDRFSEYGADANAYTSNTRTAYLFSCTDNFEKSLAELLYFVTHPYFTKQSVKSEIGIISEEISMYEDNPSDQCYYGMLKGLYEYNNIRDNICGSAESISKITPEMLYNCHKAFYNPHNMVLVVCGDVSTDDVLRIAQENLPEASPPMSVVLPQSSEQENECAFKNIVEKKMQISKPMFNIGFKDVRIPSETTLRLKKDAGMEILNEMIFSACGKLYSDLFENDIISPGWSYGYTISKLAAYNSIAGEADDPKLVLEKILEYIGELCEKGLNYDDFVLAKRIMYADFIKSFDSNDNIANNLFSYAFSEAELLSYADIINSVTFEYVTELLHTEFDEKYATISIINPINNSK